MQLSARGLSFIRSHEGLRLQAYRCPAGRWTIGYGHTGSDVLPGLRITAERAAQLLADDTAAMAAELTRWARIDGMAPLSQNRQDALLSFAYNLGVAALRSSTLWRKACRNADDPSIPAEFRRWVHAGGAVMPGLVKRREEEAALWSEK